MQSIRSIKNKAVSILAVTAMAVALTPVVPASAQEHNLSDITGPNVAEAPATKLPETTGNSNDVIKLTNDPVQASTAADLSQQLDMCVATSCSGVFNLLDQADLFLQAF